MKVVLLAGGLGTRFAEETDFRPKPMIMIGEYPILWHIIKYFASYRFNDFYIATGYKGEMIRNYFVNYRILAGSILVNLADGTVENYSVPPENWKVHLLETGVATMTGGRLLRMKKWLEGPEPFLLTYGDGLANIDLSALIRFHRAHGKIATVTAVHPPNRFGDLELENTRVVRFSEKRPLEETWINGGFFVFNQEIFDYLKDDDSVLEVDALERLASEGQLMAFRHEGFWQCMDSLREKRFLESLWNTNRAPWKIWNDLPLIDLTDER